MAALDITYMIRKFIPLLFSAAVLSLLFIVFWQRGPAPRLADISHQMEFDMNIRQFSMIQGHDGHSRWDIVSDNAAYIKDQEVFLLDHPLITFHNQNNSDPLTIRASQGMATQQDSTVHLWPDVNAIHGEIQLHSDRASYVDADRYVFLEGNVVLQGNGIEVRSPRASFSLETYHLQATGGVSTLLP